jgi:hypothetical protein
MEQTETPERKISPRGENHFSKRRSEGENKSKSREVMTDSKRNEMRRTKQKVKVKVDKAKGIEGPKNKIRT